MIFLEKTKQTLTEKEKCVDKIYEEYIAAEEYQEYRSSLSKSIWNEGDQMLLDAFPTLTSRQQEILSQIRAAGEEIGFINGYIYAVESIKKYLLCTEK